jgi:hypothetical protein
MATVFMNLELPVVSVTLGPEWASELNAAFEVVDAHDHTSGKGKLITPAAISIDDDLAFNDFRVTDAAALQVNSEASPISGIGNENAISAGAGDLYWTNSAGIAVQITDGNTIVSSPAQLEVFEYQETNVDLIIGSGDATVLVAVDTSTAVREITLPLAGDVDEGRIYIIKDATGDSETYTLTVSAAGSDEIDGESSYEITSAFGAVMLVSDGVDSYKIL